MILFVFGGIHAGNPFVSLKKKYVEEKEFRVFIKNIVNPSMAFVWYVLIVVLAFISCYLPTIFGGATMPKTIIREAFL